MLRVVVPENPYSANRLRPASRMAAAGSLSAGLVSGTSIGGMVWVLALA